MKLELFSYNLPKRSIAQKPIEPRDHSKLLIYNRPTRKIINDHFYRLDTYLRPGDVLVFNDTKVFPARLIGHKQTGGRIEVFLLKATRGNHWEALIGGKVRRVGQVISFGSGLRCKVEKQFPNGIWQVGFNKKPSLVMAIAGKIGETPTPPYVKKITKLSDYQTVYAKKVGSVAAPTAGFHFTKQLLAKLKKQGVQFEYVTLHIGYGTFQPVKANDIKKHKMHAEYAELGKRTVQRLMSAKKKGRRIIAVGTTSVRALETVYRLPATDYSRKGFHGWINSFIYPGYKFKMVDGMITNFHLPQSTLLMLVAAFAGRKEILNLYSRAVKQRYRFYSFGDGMFIH